jgi:penicillin G amidase
VTQRVRVVRLLGGLLATLLLLTGVVCGLYWHWSRAALPTISGEEELPGLGAPVTVRRDGLGVPHIQAASITDLMRAQGYVTAQDRLWQMDLLRRRALGELSEAFGEGALRIDKEIRELGLAGASREALELMPPDLRAELDAFTAGINAYIERRPLPLEFRILRYAPRKWEPADTMAVGKLLALDLASGWDGEAFRAVVGDRLPADVQDLLFPTLFPEDRILFASDGAPGAPPGGPSAGLPPDLSRGSNNWVISGAHTATGRPLLANDPHLNLGVPSLWSAVHLTAPGIDVAGVVLPGTPGVTLGRNTHLAWGATNVHDDSADLYVEEFDPRDPLRYRVGDAWEKATVRTERIRVRDGALSSSSHTVEHAVRVTRHGPMVEIQGRLYALRWTALERSCELPAFARMNRARNLDEFRAAAALFPGPSQNFVYADVDGHIAWFSAGRLPLRRSGNGARPYPGSGSDGDWLGFVPFESLPQAVDPPSGRIVTANSRLVGTTYPYKVTRGGIAPYRMAVLAAALESRGGFTADDMARLQGERLSLPHRDLAVRLRESAVRHPRDPTWEEIARELAGWDGRMEPESRAAALVARTFRSIGDLVIRPRLAGIAAGVSLSRRSTAIHRLVREQPASWLPAGRADWDAVFVSAWKDAVADVTARLGPDRSRWSWGALNELAVGHPLGQAVAPLRRLLDPPRVPAGGFSTTPNVLAISPSGGAEGPSMRFVADLADPDNTRLVNFMGQSGHPASPHYDDQFGPWLRVESPRLPFTAAAVTRETQHLLRLVP